MIALPPFHTTTSRTVETRLPHGLAQDLSLYRTFYKEAYGAEVPEADLVREIVRTFLDGDDAFRQFKRGARPRARPSRRSSGGGGTQSTGS